MPDAGEGLPGATHRGQQLLPSGLGQVGGPTLEPSSVSSRSSQIHPCLTCIIYLYECLYKFITCPNFDILSYVCEILVEYLDDSQLINISHVNCTDETVPATCHVLLIRGFDESPDTCSHLNSNKIYVKNNPRWTRRCSEIDFQLKGKKIKVQPIRKKSPVASRSCRNHAHYDGIMLIKTNIFAKKALQRESLLRHRYVIALSVQK